jgi:hypothetical protein
VDLREAMTNEWTQSFIGAFPEEFDANGKRLIDRVFRGEAVDVYKPDGRLLFALRPGAMMLDVCRRAWPALLRAARPTTHRTIAAGGQNPFHSGTVGYRNRELTFATESDLAGFRQMWPLFILMDRVFAEQRPQEYAVLERAAARKPDQQMLIPQTSITSAAVNRNARCAVHRDDGNLPRSCGIMGVICSGEVSGGWLVWPQYRVAAEVRHLDCCICDNQEPHGNTAIIRAKGAKRISVVAYYSDSNLPPA